MKCPKCKAISGDDWRQCKGMCPLEGTPHYSPSWNDNRLIEWVEPYDDECETTLICRMKVKDVVRWQRKHVAKVRPDYTYKSDEDAMWDFIAVHMARFVEPNRT